MRNLSNNQRIRVMALWLGGALLATSARAGDAVAVTHTAADKTVTVTINGELFTNYNYGNKSKPILYPIIGPYGIPMTRNFPMKQGVENEPADHPHHQSLFYSHPINGNDFWMGKKNARIRTSEILKAEMVEGQALIVSRNSWMAGDKPICTDTTEIRCGLTAGGRFIDFKISVHASHGDITFADSKEGTMAIRTHPALQLEGTVAKGSAINSTGVSGTAVWGKAAEWVDYWGPIGDKNVGIAIFDHPDNPRHPTTWHAREYGLITANPFGKRSFKQGEGEMAVKADDSVTFAYRFYFHEGAHDDTTLRAAYKAWGATYVQKELFK